MAAPLIRVGIVDDHPVVRDGMAAILSANEGLEVVGTAGSVPEAVELVGRHVIDVLLLDIRLGTDSGLRFLGDAARGGTAVVVLSAYDYPQYADAAARLGAAGFVTKSAPIDELVSVIRAAASGATQIASGPRPTRPRVSPREMDVVRLVVDGRSNDEIGVELGIKVKTVETHLRRLFERFEVASRTELAARALREGWLDIPPA